MGAQIVGKAFVEAYKQAAANAGKANISGSSSTSQKGASAAVNALTRRTGMSYEEATKILNLESKPELSVLQKNYEHLFNCNDPKKGGSLYLQSKVYRAKERIDLQLKEDQAAAAASAKKPGPKDGDGKTPPQ